ncbi:MAG TPA: hypothetical protein VN802_08610 [Stellaceae bacterium]|nr:hypothetical protein [Stellaceae bacterium]
MSEINPQRPEETPYRRAYRRAREKYQQYAERCRAAKQAICDHCYRKYDKYGHWKYIKRSISVLMVIGVLAYTIIQGAQFWVVRDQEKKQIRAYVGLALKDDISVNAGVKPNQTVEIKNFGASPAMNALFGGRIIKLPYPLPAHLNMVRDATASYSNFSLFPTQALYPTDTGDILSQNDIADVLDGSSYRLFILAHVEYDDIWGFRHFTHLCLMSVPGTLGARQHPEYCDQYNDAN